MAVPTSAATLSPGIARAMRGAAPAPAATSAARRKRRLASWFQAFPWTELFAFLTQAAEDGMSKEEAIGAAAIIVDGAVDFEQRIDGPLGVWLERQDRKLAEQGLALAWGIVERRRAAGGAP